MRYASAGGAIPAHSRSVITLVEFGSRPSRGAIKKIVSSAIKFKGIRSAPRRRTAVLIKSDDRPSGDAQGYGAQEGQAT
jgi:hypothetical protein